MTFLPLAGAAPLHAQRPVELHTFRFWRQSEAPLRDLTLVEAYATVPLSLLTFQGAPGEARRSVMSGTLAVRDSAGLELLRESWTDTIQVPALTETSMMRSDAAQHFRFQLQPGWYTLRVNITDIASGRSWTAEQRVDAFATRPGHSDLVVASDLVVVDPEGEVDPNAMVRGRLGVLPNFSGALTAEKSKLAVYTEIYRPNMPPESAQARVEVTGRSRDFRYATPSQARIYPTGIASEAFAIDLTGLPIGSYDLSLFIAMKDDTMRAQHPIEMLPPGAGDVQVTEAQLFGEVPAEQLDTTFAPMRYIATTPEIEAWSSLTSEVQKRAFLNEFWQRRATAAGVSLRTVVQDWTDRIIYVNRDFRPTIASQGGRQGWQTDRGRIYLRYGPPAERQVSQQTGSQDIKGCELWQYTMGRGDRYVFFDRTGFGDYELVYTTDRTEPSVPGMENLFRDGQFRCT